MKLLDTDICIEILRKNERVIQRRLETREPVAVTWITCGELLHGAEKSQRPAENRDRVVGLLQTLPVLDWRLEVATCFARQKASLERAGTRLADADLWIAGFALSYRVALVTGNRRHYERIPGLVLEDWIR